jgi:glycosyltransferase involved in cell wall biosynthesis
LVPQKGFDILIRAHHLLLQRNIEHRLLIIGEGPERSSLESLAAALGVADTVDMPGFQSNPFPSLQQADIFAFPSRFEGLGLALVEAMALGKPVVSCDCPSGPAEILQQGESGILVPTENPAAMADALEQLLGSSELEDGYGHQSLAAC